MIILKVLPYCEDCEDFTPTVQKYDKTKVVCCECHTKCNRYNDYLAEQTKKEGTK